MASENEPLDEAEEELGEMLDLPEDEIAEVEDTEDGGAIVRLEDEESSPAAESEFYANLAESMPEGEMDQIAQDCLGRFLRTRKRGRSVMSSMKRDYDGRDLEMMHRAALRFRAQVKSCTRCSQRSAWTSPPEPSKSFSLLRVLQRITSLVPPRLKR